MGQRDSGRATDQPAEPGRHDSAAVTGAGREQGRAPPQGRDAPLNKPAARAAVAAFFSAGSQGALLYAPCAGVFRRCLPVSFPQFTAQEVVEHSAQDHDRA